MRLGIISCTFANFRHATNTQIPFAVEFLVYQEILHRFVWRAPNPSHWVTVQFIELIDIFGHSHIHCYSFSHQIVQKRLFKYEYNVIVARLLKQSMVKYRSLDGLFFAQSLPVEPEMRQEHILLMTHTFEIN